MAKIFYNNDSSISQTESPKYIEYDTHTNELLAYQMYFNPTAYSVIDGVLTRDGQPVAINPPCEDCVTLDSVATATTVEELRKVVQLLVDKPGFRRG